MAGVIYFFVLNDKIFSSHMKQITKKTNLKNHKINNFDNTSRMIFDLGSNKGVINDDYS